MKMHLWNNYDHGARKEFKYINDVLGIKKRNKPGIQERYTMVTDQEILDIEKSIRVREKSQ